MSVKQIAALKTASALGGATAVFLPLAAAAQDAPQIAVEPELIEQAVAVPPPPPPPAPVETVIMRAEPVVQPLPEQPRYTPQSLPATDDVYEVEMVEETVMPAHHAVPAHHGQTAHQGPMHHGQMPHHAYPVQTYPAHSYPMQAYPAAHYPAQAYPHTPYPAPAAAPQFDRDEWLAECRERYNRGEGKTGIIGSLLGAVTGGIIGNRVADGERLGGTLIGAGIGGLAGAAIGSAISGSKKRRADRECEQWLDDYYAGAYRQGGGYYAPQAYTYTYTMQPVLVAIPQRRVTRDVVTEETYYDEVMVPVTTRAPAKRRIVRDKRVRTAPAAPAKPVKRTKRQRSGW